MTWHHWQVLHKFGVGFRHSGDSQYRLLYHRQMDSAVPAAVGDVLGSTFNGFAANLATDLGGVVDVSYVWTRTDQCST
ncbi:hypothetical protein D3C85_1392950 [compost metagenome]